LLCMGTHAFIITIIRAAYKVYSFDYVMDTTSSER